MIGRLLLAVAAVYGLGLLLMLAGLLTFYYLERMTDRVIIDWGRLARNPAILRLPAWRELGIMVYAVVWPLAILAMDLERYGQPRRRLYLHMIRQREREQAR